MTPWDPNDLPECLIGYAGQFASTVWFKHLCDHFSKNYHVGTHYRGLKRYKNCFVASDAVSWLRQELTTNKFKAMMTREAVARVMKMMHSNHQVFEDVRGQTHNEELFADNSRLFRFREYKIGFDDLVVQAPQTADLHSRQPFAPLENLPPLAPRVSKSSHCNKNLKELSKSSRNSHCSISSSQKSYGNVPYGAEGFACTLPRNPSNKSLISKGLRRDKSLSVQDLNEAPLNAAVSEEVDRRSEDGAAHGALFCSDLNDSRSSCSITEEQKKQTIHEHQRFFDMVSSLGKGPSEDNLMGWKEALEMSMPEVGSDCQRIELGTQPSKLKNATSFKFNNKENKEPRINLSFMNKSKKSVSRSMSVDKTKRQRNSADREESAGKPVVSEKDYKLSLIISLCKRLNVDNISRIMPVDLVDPSTVKSNIVKGDEFGLVGRESRKDFPENICSMLVRMSEWPLKTYCKYRMGIERCDASVQAMFDIVLDFLESNPMSIFPNHFHQLLAVLHDLCKVARSKSESLSRSISLERHPASTLSSVSTNERIQKERSGSTGTTREILRSCSKSPECMGSWKVDLARISEERHPRHVESSGRTFPFGERGGDLPPNKNMRNENGDFYFYREYPELTEILGWRSNCSILDTGKGRRDDLVIKNGTNGRSRSESRPLPAPSCKLDSNLLINKNSDVGEVNERCFIEALQLCFLLLGRPERRNFFRLFSFVEAVISNRGICAARDKEHMIVEALVDVMTRNVENGDILEPTFIAIYKFFVRNYRKILKVPHLDLNVDSETIEKYTGRVTATEYDIQSSNYTRNALVQLLKTIMEDPSLTEKARREHLKKFEKGYPDIFYCFFPPSDLSPETKDTRTRFLDSFRRLRDNFWQS